MSAVLRRAEKVQALSTFHPFPDAPCTPVLQLNWVGVELINLLPVTGRHAAPAKMGLAQRVKIVWRERWEIR